MYDPTRLKGIFVATTAVAIALAAFSAVSIVTCGGRPSWLASGDSTIEGGQEKIVGSRIAGASSSIRQGEKVDDLGVILGASAVGMGIDPKSLEASRGPAIPARWLSLYANGANLADLDDLADLLFMSNLHPRLLVLGLHPGLLARSDVYLNDRLTLDGDGLRQEIAAKHLIRAKDEFSALSAVPLNWAYPNRTRISNLSRGITSSTKRRMFAALGLGPGALYRAEPDPWRVQLLVEDSDAADREAAAEGRKANVRDQAEGPMREGLAGPVKDKGWSNPDAYRVDGENIQALIRLIRRSRERNIDVVILLLPESSKLRASIPPEAMTTLQSALDQDFAAQKPAIIDLRDSMPDDNFHDSIHPNLAGREATTRRLIDALRNQKPTVRP